MLITGIKLYNIVIASPGNPFMNHFLSMEAKGSINNQASGTLHYGGQWPNNKYTGAAFTFPGEQKISDWHIYSLEWEPGEFRWYIDGQLYQTQNSWYTRGANTAADYTYPAPFDQPFYIIMNLAVGGNFDGNPDESTVFPADMQVDYVRVYDLTGRPYRTPVKPDLSKDPVPDNARQPLSDGNLVYNGGFDQNNNSGSDDPAVRGVPGVANTDYWQFLHVADFGGNGNLSIDTIDSTNYAKIDITSPGNQNYSVQLVQDYLPMVRGHFYKVSFDAKAAAARSIASKVDGGPGDGYKTYSNSEIINISSSFKHYEYMFQMTQPTDVNSRLEINVGLSDKSVWIGNVKVEEIDGIAVDENTAKTPLDDGNHIYNGTFDQGWPDRMIFWNFNTTGATAAADVSEVSRELKVGITDDGSSPDTVQLVQKGLSQINGQSYEVSFRARAAEARTIEVEVLSKDGTVSYSDKQTVNLSTSMDRKTFRYTMSEANDPEAQIVFRFGGANTDVYLDDVVMLRTSDYIDPNVVLFPLKNGDFESSGGQLGPWNVHSGDGTAADVSIVNGELKAAIAGTGTNPWSVMPYQDGMNLSGGIDYLLEFDARSTVARDIEITLENSSYNRYLDKTVPLAGDMRRYSFTFKMPKDDVCGLEFLIGNVSGAASIGAHDVFIDNVVFEVKSAKQHASMLKNGTFIDGANGWTVWSDTGATHSVDNGVLDVSINNEGTQFWSVQVVQGNFALDSSKSYVLTFDASSSLNRNIQAIVEHSGNPYTSTM